MAVVSSSRSQLILSGSSHCLQRMTLEAYLCEDKDVCSPLRSSGSLFSEERTSAVPSIDANLRLPLLTSSLIGLRISWSTTTALMPILMPSFLLLACAVILNIAPVWTLVRMPATKSRPCALSTVLIIVAVCVVGYSVFATDFHVITTRHRKPQCVVTHGHLMNSMARTPPLSA